MTAPAGRRALAHVRTLVRHARTQAGRQLRSSPACDARRSVLPSKPVALATLSSDLNMVAFSIKACGVQRAFVDIFTC